MHQFLLVLYPPNSTYLSLLTSHPIAPLTFMSMSMIFYSLEVVSSSFNKQSPNLITNLPSRILEPQITSLPSKQKPPPLDYSYPKPNIFQTSLPKQRCSMPNQLPHQWSPTLRYQPLAVNHFKTLNSTETLLVLSNMPPLHTLKSLIT